MPELIAAISTSVPVAKWPNALADMRISQLHKIFNNTAEKPDSGWTQEHPPILRAGVAAAN